MGWTSTHVGNLKNKKADGIKEFLLGRWERESKLRVIDYSKTGSTVYMAIKIVETGIVFAHVTLISFNDNEFYWKEMDETCGPCYYDCPKRILDKLSDTDNYYALEWRQDCMGKIAKKSVKYNDGDIIKFDNIITFGDGHKSDTFILCKDGRTERFAKCNDGKKNGYPSYMITKWKLKSFKVIGNVKNEILSV